MLYLLILSKKLFGDYSWVKELIPNRTASTPTERRGYNAISSRLVATSLCRGAVVPNPSASTPTERRGYNAISSRLVATSLVSHCYRNRNR
jgi:hypothetical protein